MHSRGFRILLLLFVAVWFGAIVPGHTRGVVRVPGTASHERPDGGSCCAAKAPASSDKKVPAKACCAVCFFAAALMHVPPVEFDVARLGLVGSLAPPCSERLVLSLPYRVYLGRGPPVRSV